MENGSVRNRLKKEIENLLTAWINGDILDAPNEITEKVWALAHNARENTPDDLRFVSSILKDRKTVPDVAFELGVSATAVRHRLHSVLRRLNHKKYSEGCLVKPHSYTGVMTEYPPQLAWLRGEAEHFIRAAV